jgi:hypothetical protein
MVGFELAVNLQSRHAALIEVWSYPAETEIPYFHEAARVVSERKRRLHKLMLWRAGYCIRRGPGVLVGEGRVSFRDVISSPPAAYMVTQQLPERDRLFRVS